MPPPAVASIRSSLICCCRRSCISCACFIIFCISIGVGGLGACGLGLFQVLEPLSPHVLYFFHCCFLDREDLEHGLDRGIGHGLGGGVFGVAWRHDRSRRRRRRGG